MKKSLFILILFALPFLLPAQNYKNICTSGFTYYKKHNSNDVKGYRVDSLGIPMAGDTLFRSFRIMIDTNYIMCGDTTKGSVLGLRVYKKSNGWFYFFNKGNDTIYINTQANLGDVWVFYNLTPSTYLQAEVTALGQDTVLGLLDNVKTITLQGKRSNGTSLPHLFNGKTLKLSEHYGLSKTFNMVMTPYDTTWYKLAGKTNGALGIQDFGWKEVYNLQIGDLMHYSGYHTAITTAGGPSTTWLTIKKVLTKTVHGNNDSVTYTFERCRREQVVSTLVSTTTYDTITKTYNFVQLANDSSILRMPEEFIRKNNYASGYGRKMDNYRTRQTKEVGTDRFRFLNNCWVLPEFGTINNNWYTEGLGITEYYKKNSNFYEGEHIVYYKKGMEIWGTPVSTDCNTLVGVDEVATSGQTKVRVVPNPVSAQADIIVEGAADRMIMLTLYDPTGRAVYTGQTMIGRHTFNRAGIARGLYILTVSGRDGSALVTTKVVID